MSNKIKPQRTCPRARRKGKIFVIQNAVAGEFHHIFHADADGNLFPHEVRRLLTLTMNSKTDQEQIKYDKDRAKYISMQFNQSRIRRKEASNKVTWKSEPEFIDAPHHANHSCPILHEVCDNSNDEQPSTKNQSTTRVSAGNITTLTGRRKGKTKVTWKPEILNCDDNIKPGVLNSDPILHNWCDKSKDDRQNGATKYQSNAEESQVISNLTTPALRCIAEIKVILKPEIVNLDDAASQHANRSGSTLHDVFRNTKYQSNPISNITMLARRRMAEINLISKPEMVNVDDAATQYANGSGSNLHDEFKNWQGTKTGAGGNPERQETGAPFNPSFQKGPMASENAHEHHDKTVSGEYEIPRPPNKPGGYSNLGVYASNLGVYYSNLKFYAGVILFAYIVVDSIFWWIRCKLRATRIQEFKQKLEARYARITTWGTEFRTKIAAKSKRDNKWEQKCLEQLINSKFCPQKQERKEVRIHKKWARGTTGSGTSVVHPTTPNTVTPGPPSGSGIFMFGSAKKPASDKNVFSGTCSSIRRTVIKKMKNYPPSKDSNGIVSPKKRKTSKKLKRRNKHSKWLLEQKHRNPIRAINPEGDRHQPAYRIREQPRNKYVLCENKKPAIHVGRKRRRAWYIAPKKGNNKKKEVRYREDETTTLSNIKWWKIPLAVRQAPSPAVRYARLQSNKQYKPGD